MHLPYSRPLTLCPGGRLLDQVVVVVTQHRQLHHFLVSIPNAPHLQPWQVGDRDFFCLGDRDWRASDRGGMVDDDVECSMFAQSGDQGGQSFV